MNNLDKNHDEISTIDALQEQGFVKVEASPHSMDLSDTSRFTKLNISSEGKIHMSALLSQSPNLASAAAMSGMYTVKFPEGVTGTMMKLKQGGLSTVLKGADGKITGTASLFQATASAATLGIFTVMSIASQQYFLAQINKELKFINQKIDKILGFLYGDKKAELLSEICFIQRAFRDYSSIMANEPHQIATIAGIQQAGKVAMKDIEFYIRDLERTVNREIRSRSELVSTAQTAIQIHESLDASLQLYITSGILEVYYTQTTDASFLENLESDLSLYTNKCYSRMLSSLSILKGKVNVYKVKGKFDKEPILDRLSTITAALQEGKSIETQQAISTALESITKETTFVITDNGEVYHQIA